MATPAIEYVLAEGSKQTIVFIHGWPDDYRIFDKQAEYFSKEGHRCIRICLPNFSGKLQNLWGYDLPVVADAIGNTIIKLQEPSKGKVVLVGHDWGAIMAYMVEKQFPHIVSHLVTIDIGANVGRVAPLAGIAILSYQLWLTCAFLITNLLPFVGPAIGKIMTELCAKYYARAPSYKTDRTGYMNYPYMYLWKQKLFGGDGGVAPLTKYDNTAPLLYVWGDKKPFHFHNPKWVARLSERGDGSKGVPLKTNHWVQYKAADEFNALLKDFIAK